MFPEDFQRRNKDEGDEDKDGEVLSLGVRSLLAQCCCRLLL
jgi:hypothetical protein